MAPTIGTCDQGFGSASISCGSGSSVLKTDADPDPDTDPDPRPEFLRVKKYLKNFKHFFSSIFTDMKKIENVFKKLPVVFSL